MSELTKQEFLVVHGIIMEALVETIGEIGSCYPDTDSDHLLRATAAAYAAMSRDILLGMDDLEGWEALLVVQIRELRELQK